MSVSPLQYLAKLSLTQWVVAYDSGNQTVEDTCDGLLGQLDGGSWGPESAAILQRVVQHYGGRLTPSVLYALTPQHAKELSLPKCPEISGDFLGYMLKRCPQLQKLDMSDNPDLDLSCVSLFSSPLSAPLAQGNPHHHLTSGNPHHHLTSGNPHHHLTSVSLEDCTSVGDQHIQALIWNAPNLAHLNIAHCDVTDAVFLLDETKQFAREAAIDLPPSFSRYDAKLQCVDVSRNSSVSSTGVRHLCTLCGPSLREVNVCWTKVDCTALLYLSGLGLPAAVQFYLSCDFLQEGVINSLLATLDTFKHVVEQIRQSCDDVGRNGDCCEGFSETSARDESLKGEGDACCLESCVGDHERKGEGPGGDFDSISVIRDKEINHKRTELCMENSIIKSIGASTTISKECETNLNVNEDEEGFIDVSTDRSFEKITGDEEFECKPPQCNSEQISDSGTMDDEESSNAFASKDCEFSVNYEVMENNGACETLESAISNTDSNSKCVVEDTCSCDQSFNGVEQSEKKQKPSIVQGMSMCKLNNALECLDPVNKLNDKHSPCNDSGIVLESSSKEEKGELKGVMKGDKLDTSVREPDCSCKDCLLLESKIETAGLLISQEKPKNGLQRKDKFFSPNILKLSVNGGLFKEELIGLQCFQRCLMSNPSMNTLSLYGGTSCNFVTDNTLTVVGQHCCQLTSLCLQGCDKVTDVGLTSLANCRLLSLVDFTGLAFITDPGLLQMMKNHRLSRMLLAESQITNLALKVLAEKPFVSELEELDLSWCEDIEGDEQLNSLIQACTSLRKLRLRVCPLSPLSLSLISQHCRNLTELSIASNMTIVSDESVVCLSRHLPLLEVIDLGWNQYLSNVAIHSLLQNCRRLTTAHLEGLKQITSAPFVNIIAVPEELLTYIKHILVWTPDNSDDIQFTVGELPALPRRSSIYCTELQELYLNYSDLVDDKHLEEIVTISHSSIMVVNYYGETVEEVPDAMYRYVNNISR